MAIQVTPPGANVEELPSGQHTIVPVATNIAAFLGRALTGPTDRPVTIFNYGDFTQAFGGLVSDYPLSYSVQDFFANGGSEAIVARLFEPSDGDGFARLEFPAAGSEGDASAALSLRAASPGGWGNYLSAEVDRQGISDSTAELFKEYGLDAADLFNLTLSRLDESGRPVATERYVNLSVKSAGTAADFPSRLDRMLEDQSNLARVESLPALPPADGASATAMGGNDGQPLRTPTYLGDRSAGTGMYLLDKAHLFNLLCIPPDRRILPDVPEGEQDLDPVVRQAAASYCAERRAFYIVDPPVAWTDAAKQGRLSSIDPKDVGITGMNSAGSEVARNAAVYFPRIWNEDILADSRPALFAPSGAIAGVFAATDFARGVWKAPAGIDAGFASVVDLEINLTDDENGQLNPLGINCLRKFPVYGPVVWGARTLYGADQLADDYKYVPIRRLTLFIEESLYEGTGWAAFEPNDEALWSSLRLSVGSFLADLSRQGAFYQYAVSCDSTTTTQADIDNGIVNIVVQIAPVKPAEFIVLQIQQQAAQPG